MNVLSLSGLPGIGENIVTHGLGPGVSAPPPPPPPPTPIRPKVLPSSPSDGGGGGGGWGPGERWREEWRESIREIRRKNEERAAREIIESLAGPVDEVETESPEPDASHTDPEPLAEVQLLPIGIHARVRAEADGIVSYNEPEKIAEVVADDGARHVYEGVSRIATGPSDGDRVEVGQTIARAALPVIEHRVAAAPPPTPGPYPTVEVALGPTVTESPWIAAVPVQAPIAMSQSESLPRAGVAATPVAKPTASTGVSIAKAAIVVAAGVAGAALIARSASVSTTSTKGPKGSARPRSLRTSGRPRKTDSTISKAVDAAIRSIDSGAAKARASGNPYPTAKKQVSSKPAAKPTRSPRPARPAYPADASIQEKWIKCGKDDCVTCPHGPYYYAMWRDGDRVKTKYIGKKIS